jgi:hypothetical protein
MKTTNNIIYIICASLALMISPIAQAVFPYLPVPDGGYPGNNTAEGTNAWLSGGGTYNTALGFQALSNNISNFNTATGANAMTYNLNGAFNTANGYQALLNNNSSYNTATGSQALYSNTVGSDNTATGFQALYRNTTGKRNTATGYGALYSNTTRDGNTATGWQALFNNTIGEHNTATGHFALSSNTTGSENLAYGSGALYSNTTGYGNAAYGGDALSGNTTGSSNVGLGLGAGFGLTTGDNNIDIGFYVSGGADESKTIRIGTQGTQTGTYIAGIYGTTVAKSVAVFIDSNGHLGTKASSQRFKDEIKPMDNASEAILALKPVSFRYKKEIDPDRTPQFGLVAEQVQKVNPDLVVRDADGKPYTVRYEAVNAMLLNEFLKEHRKVEAQEATIAKLQKQVDALTAGLQKVSAQLEVSKSTPQTVSKATGQIEVMGNHR